MKSSIASKLVGATLALAATLVVTTPASATVTTFATFSPIGSNKNLWWANTSNSTNAVLTSISTPTAVLPGSANVRFSFLNSSLSPSVTNVTARFFMTAAVINTRATLTGGDLNQDNIGGGFSFISTTAITVGGKTYAAGSNLLTGIFGGAAIAGQRNGLTGSFTGSSVGSDTLVYSSDFLNFDGVNNSSFAMSLSSLNAPLNAAPIASNPTRALRTFRASVAGQFSTDPAPAPVPEPATWAMMLAGFGMIGFGLRRRRKHSVRVTYA